MTVRPLFTVALLLLALLGTGITAYAGDTHGSCGMDGMTATSEATSSVAGCGHPLGSTDTGCQQCAQCTGGHCAGFAVPAAEQVQHPLLRSDLFHAALPDHASGTGPVRLYRPPRFFA